MKRAIDVAVILLCLAALCFLVPDGQVTQAAQNALYTGRELPGISWRVQPYGAFLALGTAAALLVSMIVCRRKVTMEEGLRFFAIAAAGGIVLSRALYCVVNPAYYSAAWMEKLARLRIWDGGMMMTGALLAAVIAGWAVKPARRMIPLALAVFLFFARIGEIHTQMGYGTSVQFHHFMARKVSIFAMRLNVNYIEAAAALLILAAVLIARKAWRWRRDTRRTVIFFYFLYGCLQVLMESLRKDQHAIWGFTKAQQIISMVMALVCLLLMARDRKDRLAAIGLTLPTAGLLVALEFALDKLDLHKLKEAVGFLAPVLDRLVPSRFNLYLYLVYMAVLGLYMFLAIRRFFGGKAKADPPAA